MPSSRRNDEEFISRLTQIVEENLSNEQFGVNELAQIVGMSRSNLLRKVSKLQGVSVSLFIRKVRLEKALEILQEGVYSVSEISYQVGFGSPSYFIKCFREEYGYSPGNMDAYQEEQEEEETSEKPKRKFRMPVLLVSLFLLVTMAAVIVYILKPGAESPAPVKSIAVLPFINDSNDSSNVYIINGLMESTLNKLQSIEGLRVISRTSAEKYRIRTKTIREIAKELNVTYLVEGSGQKIGDKLLLNVQLIEASADNQVWSRQYQRNTSDIFALQNEIAKDITNEIKVIVTPEEQSRIEKIPTESLEAYDLFLQGIDLLSRQTEAKDNLRKSIELLRRALVLDPKFARANAALAMSYYFLEQNHSERLLADSINYFADQAMFLDSQLPQSLIAKALFYMAHAEYQLAVPYFEKALEYNPNYDLVYVFLVDLYANYLPDTRKYLEYTLRGLQIDPARFDPVTMSFNFLHISNAFIQAGFVDEAEKYINVSLDYYPGNLYSEYVKAYILFARDNNLQQTKELLLEAARKDTMRLDIIQEVAKICYYRRDYESAYKYYQKYLGIKKMLQLSVYPQEDIKIAFTCQQLGKTQEAEQFLASYKHFADNDRSIYRSLNLSTYYAATGQNEEALNQLKLFAGQKNFQYWIVLFLPIDPIMDAVRVQPGYSGTFKQIKANFKQFHNEVKESLEEKGLI